MGVKVDESLPRHKKDDKQRWLIILVAVIAVEALLLTCLAFFIKTNILVALILTLSFQIPLAVRFFVQSRKAKRNCRIASVFLFTAGLIACLACHGRNYYIESTTKADNTSVSTERYEPFNALSDLGRLDEEPELLLTEELPVLNGCASLLPLYSSVVNMVYPEDIAGLNEADSPYRFTNTDSAFEELFSGKTDLVFSEEPSEALLQKAQEQGIELEVWQIGWNALVFFTNSSNPVVSLTQEQLRDIYSGKITNWSELGGDDTEITAFQCNQEDDAQKCLEQFMKGRSLMEPRQEFRLNPQNGITETASTYINESGAIGFSYLHCSRSLNVDLGINFLCVDGIYPQNDRISSGEYPLAGPIYCVAVQGNVSANTQKLVEWLLSEQGQRLVEAAGYVPD